jgi:MoaA/NifB/PqqE/SkfB family radical SAM enzyme
MNLKGIHFLLTYQCLKECDHCFVWGSPFAEGTFTLNQVREILKEGKKLGTVEWIFFEGGEPFLYYPILVQALRQAKQMGFKIGIVTNTYWATSVEDALEWLRPIADVGIDDLSFSSDCYHNDNIDNEETNNAIKAAKQLKLPAGIISIKQPEKDAKEPSPTSLEGVNVGYSQVMLRGRATSKLLEKASLKPWDQLTECPEPLKNPGRVHLDPLGYVHICQGLCMGNAWKQPLSEIMNSYDPLLHPVVRALLQGGPAALVKEFNLPHEQSYADACHLCYSARIQLRPRFPDLLAPSQMYGEGLETPSTKKRSYY